MAGHGSTPPPDRGSHPGRQVGREFSTAGMSDADIRAHRIASRAYELRPLDEDTREEGRRLNAEGYD